MKHLEDTPWWICDPDDINYVAYSDTDSIYIHAEPLLRYLYSNFEEMPSEEKDDKLEEIALKYQHSGNRKTKLLFLTFKIIINQNGLFVCCIPTY